MNEGGAPRPNLRPGFGVKGRLGGKEGGCRGGGGHGRLTPGGDAPPSLRKRGVPRSGERDHNPRVPEPGWS